MPFCCFSSCLLVAWCCWNIDVGVSAVFHMTRQLRVFGILRLRLGGLLLEFASSVKHRWQGQAEHRQTKTNTQTITTITTTLTKNRRTRRASTKPGQQQKQLQQRRRQQHHQQTTTAAKATTTTTTTNNNKQHQQTRRQQAVRNRYI